MNGVGVLIRYRALEAEAVRLEREARENADHDLLVEALAVRARMLELEAGAA